MHPPAKMQKAPEGNSNTHGVLEEGGGGGELLCAYATATHDMATTKLESFMSCYAG
jgi:hypothetical protein